MTTTSYNNPAIAQVLWPADSNPRLRAAVLILAGVVLTTISAKIKIPFHPVPMTLQTMIVLLLGMAYGTKLAAATMVAYLAAGAVGIPVFAGTPEKGIGLAYMIGPTGGYLLGFVVAAVICGELARRGFDNAIWKVAFAMVIGNLVIYALGVLWLGAVIGWDKPLLSLGVYPFLLGGVAKITLAAIALPPVARMVRKR